MAATSIFVCVSGFAAIVATDLGTAAPPGVLGGYAMTAFPPDPQPAGYASVAGVVSPLGGTITFSRPGGMDALHAIVGIDWATWSHGYSGDIYYTAGDTSITLGLPGGTVAFYAYAEPNPMNAFTITATANDGTFLSLDADGRAGARGYGFHTTGGSLLTSITFTSTVDFAVGEFGIAVPEPEAYAAFAGLGLVGFGMWRRVRTNRS